MAVRLRPGDVPGTLAFLKGRWQEHAGDAPFEYHFLDQELDQLYQGEMRLEKIFEAFAGLTIFIACLGLFGLASFTAEQRTREIGIRKALGASAISIVTLLSREFTVLVVIANGLAWPLAYFAMHRWLDNFAYRNRAGSRAVRSGRNCGSGDRLADGELAGDQSGPGRSGEGAAVRVNRATRF